MTIAIPATLTKAERLHRKLLVDRLFAPGQSRSLSAYPLRVVFQVVDRGPGDPAAQILVSVPKRHFKHAVDRNRVKRQVREAYRHHKQVVWQAMEQHPGQQVIMAFIWLSDELAATSHVDSRLSKLLRRVAEAVTPPAEQPRSAAAEASQGAHEA